MVLMAAAYKMLGYSIEVTRGVSLGAGALAVALFFAILRVLQVRRPMATMGALLFAAHPLFWWLCRSGRMDLVAIDLGLLAILFAATGRSSSTMGALVTGLLVGIGGLFHVMVLAWAPAISMANAFKGECIVKRHVLLMLAGAIFPLVVWAALAFAVGDGPAFQEQFIGYQLSQRSAAGSIWRRPLAELWLFVYQTKFQPTLPLIVVAGVWLSCRNQTRLGRWTLAGWLMAICLIGFGTAKGTGAYPLYWYVWGLMVAIVALQRSTRTWALAILWLAIINGVGVQSGMAAIGLYQKAAREPSRVDRFFAEHIRPGSVVVGPEDIWYSLEHVGAKLRIWVEPDRQLHDYAVTYANVPPVEPNGFVLLAELPDIMPKVAGRYFSHTSCSYRIWVASPPPP